MRWEDCGFDNQMISINHNMVYRQQDNGKSEFHATTPKTSAGVRIVPMLEEVRKALLQERKKQMATGFNTTVIDGYAKGLDISIYTTDFQNEFISLTDIARYKSDMPHDVIKNWLRSRDTIEFLGLWESLHNPDFKQVEFDLFRNEAGANAFTMSPTKWIEGVNAIGLVSKAGRYGGTYAHSDIAFEFASWVSAEFKLYIIKDYQRLKYDENSRLSLDWNLHRELSKINYRIHTDATFSCVFVTYYP